MWDKLRRQIAVERKLLNRLLESHKELRDRCLQVEPGPVEISALAAMLHSFYTGLENAFKRIALQIDGGVAQGPTWHSQLLDRMAEATEQRPPVISAELRDHLRAYMAFRHMFRHAYSFDLHWDHMKPLVSGCEEVLRQVEKQLGLFLGRMPQ